MSPEVVEQMTVDVNSDASDRPGVPELPELPQGAPAGCPFAPPEAVTKLREESPLAQVALPDGTSAWLATSYELVREILTLPGFSVNPKAPGFPRWNLPGGTDLPLSMTHADPPEHPRLRGMVAAEFTPKRIARMRPDIERITRERCEAIEALPQPVDLVKEFSTPIPATAISLLLGVPADELDFFERNVRIVLAHDELESEERDHAKLELLQYVLKLIELKRTEPDGNLLSMMISDHPELSDIELVSFVALLLFAGFSTTAHQIELTALTLIERPDLAERARKDPSVIPVLAEELLRYHAIVRDSPRRVAVEDVELGGVTIRAGEGVIASVQAANWDAAAFPDPDVIDLDRPRSPRHLAFGHGIHVCLGAAMARIELEVVLEHLVTRYPDMRLAIPQDQIQFRTTTHLHGCYSLPVDLGLKEGA
ncbi:cytochrome P450 [[Kitasatospora] papulosa]|uniref:cytochrome P450 n=1 Tax=[Kitasatospora] papulosa TaxID=1464011 RepID=UPI00403C5EE5